MFPPASPRGIEFLNEKKNLLFPSPPVIKCLLFSKNNQTVAVFIALKIFSLGVFYGSPSTEIKDKFIKPTRFAYLNSQNAIILCVASNADNL